MEGGLVAVNDDNRSGSGSGAAVRANDAPLTVFEIISHYDYDHTGCIDFSPDFTIYSECSTCKYQDCKAKHDGVIYTINALTASVKEMTSKRGVIPSKRISYPYTPLDIKAAKRRRKDTFKASSSIEKSKIVMLPSLSCTDVQYARTTEKQHEPKKLEISHNEECLINIIKGFSIPAGLPWHLIDEVYISINCNDEFHWILAVVVLKERRILVYDSMSRRRRFRPSSEIQKLAKILPTYLDMSGFLDQKLMRFLDMADPVWNVTILRDVMRELQKEVHDLQWELAAVRVRMLQEIRKLRRALLLPVEDWPAGYTNNNDDDDNN
ncbi:hypothetical protein BC332_13137 [Capsicum chinense]|nr:hypothetical protein BC332_13137 [Capsicum chinense]